MNPSFILDDSTRVFVVILNANKITIEIVENVRIHLDFDAADDSRKYPSGQLKTREPFFSDAYNIDTCGLHWPFHIDS